MEITDTCSACFEQRTVFTQQVLAKALGHMVHGKFTMRLKCLPQYDPSRSFHADPRSYICYWKICDYAYTYRSKITTPSVSESKLNFYAEDMY
ncbi:hypothetical protein Bca52824_044410 [Brassica carinata]|uniref:Uncharacterized protein n=1 Tax=Brassica carinata TaxID=52824 RepID=A0A8X7V2Z5_BRACI|nr:hypothetical protein Bca52824_044410 [Brassica carinata]